MQEARGASVPSRIPCRAFARDPYDAPLRISPVLNLQSWLELFLASGVIDVRERTVPNSHRRSVADWIARLRGE